MAFKQRHSHCSTSNSRARPFVFRAAAADPTWWCCAQLAQREIGQLGGLSWRSQPFQSHHSADGRSFPRNFGSFRRASYHIFWEFTTLSQRRCRPLSAISISKFRPTVPLIAFGSPRGVALYRRRTGTRTVPLTSLVMSISMRLRTLSGRAVNAGIPYRSQARKAQPVGTRIRYLISPGAECVRVLVRFVDRLVPTPRLPRVDFYALPSLTSTSLGFGSIATVVPLPLALPRTNC
jgi:hypothetical protein